MGKSGLTTTVAGALALTFVASSAAAQRAAAPPAAPAVPAASDTIGEEIVVTAQKREQALFEVPQSISVVSSHALESREARTIADYAALVPGLSLEQGNPGNTRVVLRGINAGGASPTVAVYVDDVPFGSSTTQTNGAVIAGDFDTFDVERLEVLRGPQGTLYGANSLGGVVKYVTKAPRLSKVEVKGAAGVETVTGGDAGYFGNAVINLPLGDTAAVRASGFYRRSGGYIDAIGIPGKNVNSSDSYGGRASLLFKPSDRLSFRLTAVLQNIRANSRAAFDAVADTLRPVDTDPVSGAAASGRNIYERYPDKNDVNYRLYSGTLDYDLGFATLTSVTSYSRLFQSERTDVSFADLGGISLADFTSLNIYQLATPDYGIYFPSKITQKKFTQEVRLASPHSDKLEWLVGGYFTREPGQIYQRYLPYVAATGQPILPPPALPDGSTNLLLAQLDSKYRELAAFGSVTLHLGPRFDITAGGRYSHNHQRTAQILSGGLVGADDNGDGHSSQSVFTWSISPRYEIGDRSEIYVRVAKGYRPGGPNVVPPGAGPDYPVTTKADTLVSYEAGLRTETANHLFGFDGSVYYLDWKNTLITATFQTSVGPVNADANGEGAHSYGAEITATLRPLPGLSVVGSVAYNHADLIGVTGNGGADGDQLPFAPHWNASLSADYSWTMGGDVQPYVGADVARVSARPGNFDAGYQAFVGHRLTLPGYTTVNLRAGAQIGRFDVSLYAKNLGNSHGLSSAGSFGIRPGGTVSAVPIRPRTIGVSLGFAL